MAERSYRLTGFALLAWASMVGVLSVMAAVKWNQPEFGDPDMSGPLEMAFFAALSMFIPLGLAAGGLLAPLVWLADRIVGGRLSFTANVVIGACLSIPAAGAFLVAGWLIFGNGARMIANFRRSPDLLVAMLMIFAVGGVVMSLAMRRRSRD
jgi:hypothetical protein